MEVESVLVTGANRGIGLELVRQLVGLSKPPKFVFATYRNYETAQALEKIRDSSDKSQVIMIKMDITVSSEVKAASNIVKETVGEKGLNLLINNAGALKFEGFRDITEENMFFHFKTNTMGPLFVLKELFPLLQQAATAGLSLMGVSKALVLNISAVGGSNAFVQKYPDVFLEALGYRISKAALNMAMSVVAADTRNEGILVVQMCPGLVKTDMGTDACHLTFQESVSAILGTVPNLNEKHHGTFIDRHGEPISF